MRARACECARVCVDIDRYTMYYKETNTERKKQTEKK